MGDQDARGGGVKRRPRTPPRVRRVAVLGLGAMGRRHLRVMHALPARFAIACVYDTVPSLAREVGGSWGVEPSYDEAEAIERADLVVIATPIRAHTATGVRALRAGRDVFVEKPIAAHCADGQAL